MDREHLSTLFDLSGRVAIVTGGTRGIGRAIAEGFVAAGAKVVVASRKAEACAETEAYLVAMGGEALGVPAHLGDLDTPALLVSSAVERFGRLDIIVNNAANALALPIGQVTAEGWEKSYAVNLRGPVFLVQEAVPQLTASPCAAVINVISSGAFMFSPNLGMYAGAKAAMMAWTRTMAAELALRGFGSTPSHPARSTPTWSATTRPRPRPGWRWPVTCAGSPPRTRWSAPPCSSPLTPPAT